MSASALAFLIVACQGEPQAPVLRVGESVHGVIAHEDALVRSPSLEGHHQHSVVRGRPHDLQIADEGHYTIELRSHFFDSYLVVRGPNGFIAENDDGLLRQHARISCALKPGVYRIEACALHDESGGFELRVIAGIGEVPTGPDRARAELDDARARLSAREKALGSEHLEVVETLEELAIMLHEAGNNDEAEPLMRRALVVKERIFEEGHKELQWTLNQLALVLTGRSLFDEATALLRRVLEAEERKSGTNPAEMATTLNNLADLLGRRSAYAEAEELFLRAEEILRRTVGAEHPYVAGILSNQASVFSAQGKWSQAEARLREALQILEHLPDKPLYLATILCNLADVLTCQLKCAEANTHVERALAIRVRELGAVHPQVRFTIGVLGRLRREQGNHAEAEALFRRALDIENADDAQDPEIAQILADLAQLLGDQGKLAEAEQFSRRALDMREHLFAEDHTEIATNLNDLGWLLHLQGSLSQAESYFRRALDIRERVLGPQNSHVARSYLNLAASLHEQGRHAEALPYYEKSLGIAEAVHGREHSAVAITLNNLASLHQHLGAYAQAESLQRRALAINEKALGPEHPETLLCLENLFALLGATHRFAEAAAIAESLSDRGLRHALSELCRAVGEDSFRIGGEQLERLQYLLGCLAYEESSPALVDRAWRQVSSSQGIVFRQWQRIDRAVATDPTLAEKRKQLGELQDQLGALRDARLVADTRLQGVDIDTLFAKSRLLEQEILAELLISPSSDQAVAPLMSQRLPAGSLLIDFISHRPYRFARVDDGKVVEAAHLGPPRISCFVLRPAQDHVSLHDLGDAASLEQLIERMLHSVDVGTRSPKDGRSPEAQQDESPLNDLFRELGERLIAPIAPLVAGSSRIFVCVDGALARVPFDALPHPAGGRLVEKIDLVYVQDPITLAQLLERPPPKPVHPALLCVGDVAYLDSEEWQPLPETAVEVDAIFDLFRSRFGSEAPAALLRGAAATPAALRACIAGKHFVHLATHAFFEKDGATSLWDATRSETSARVQRSAATRPQLERRTLRPLEGVHPDLLTGLVFAATSGVRLGGGTDGILTGREVVTLDLSSCLLAVLSACETSLGSAQSGEGLVGLRRAFSEAGANTVISSLWKVDDRATRVLMSRFYEDLWTNHQPISEALRQAKLYLLRETEFKHPRYWAAFGLTGEWR